jgi:hypothetical protein
MRVSIPNRHVSFLCLLHGFLFSCGSSTLPPVSPASESPPTSDPPAPKPATTSTPIVEQDVGGLNELATVKTFHALLVPMERCQDKRRNQEGGLDFLAGEVTVELRIRADGTVRHAFLPRTTLGDRQTEQCILSAVKSATWPKPEGGEGVAKNEFQLPVKGSQKALPMDAAKVGAPLRSASHAIRSCRRGSKASFSATAYVASDGSVLSAGVSQPEANTDTIADCIAKVIEKWKVPSPGDGLSKVTFVVPL